MSQDSFNPEPAVSVIISTRDRAHYLPDVLRTLVAQECAVPFEIVVIDNGSTDGTAEVLQEWCSRDPRIRTAPEPRPGLSRGKNAGIRTARAPLLLFTDDDVQVHPGWIAAYYALFSRNAGDTPLLAGGPIIPIPDDLRAWPEWLADTALADAGMLDHRQQRELQRFEYVWGGNMAVPRTVFDRFGFWDESAGLQGKERVTREDSEFFEDTELQDRVRKAGGATWFCAQAVVHHRVNRASVTPRRICSTAFARGRNDFWQQQLRIWQVAERVPRRNGLEAMAALTANIVRWGFWLTLFRASSRRALFERARSAAFESGVSLESLRAGRKSKRLFLSVAKIALPTRSLLLRLTPDVA